MENKEFDLYNDIRKRCNGEIYIGVVGPVRTGKSTFIKHFMEKIILPGMEDENAKERATDELPQSAKGRTITTTEPKFVPNEAALIDLGDGLETKVRLIDCVGYMVDGAMGHMENDAERMVKTPWFNNEIPFTQAAEIGTDRVISDHSTIGIVVTTDGSFSEIQRENYLPAEEKTINKLKALRKPFIVLVNTTKPYSQEAEAVADEIEKKYDVTAITVNCEQLRKEDIKRILEKVLYEFPISALEFSMPKWLMIPSREGNIKESIINCVRDIMPAYTRIRDILDNPLVMKNEYVEKCTMESINLQDGVIKFTVFVDSSFYYDMISDILSEDIKDEYTLVKKLQEYAAMRDEYGKVKNAVEMVRNRGYGVVSPIKEEIVLNKPELIRHGNKYGVKIKAISPSIHMIKANIETEIAPIVGTKEQADDLIEYITRADAGDGIWDTNIFGKTVEQLVNDGINLKVAGIGDESQQKLQDTMQKIVNDINGGMICIII